MHPVGEVAVDVEGQGRVADGDVELDLGGETTEVKSWLSDSLDLEKKKKNQRSIKWEQTATDFWIGSVFRSAPKQDKMAASVTRPAGRTGGRSHHLNDGQVLLPPQVLLDLGSTGGQAVVQVHQDVNGCVHVSTKEGCAGKRKRVFTIRTWS